MVAGADVRGALQVGSRVALLRALTRSPDTWAFVLLTLLKSAMAVSGLQALLRWGPEGLRPAGRLVIPTARAWIWTYVWMQVVDTAQAIRQGYGWTSLVHHLASGLGFAADAHFGTDRTAGLALMALAGESVAPFYQSYGLLKGAGLGSSRLALLCIRGVVACTFFVRLPLAIFLGSVACKDTWRALRSRRSKCSGVQEDISEVQPWLLIPAAGGVQLILYLDYLWIKGWALPKLREAL
eukprot:TRINITY_DN46187_c0_g1_i1.p1 TRINITY_DN46187_c0_g1~~TRINITY_DN46187_c0_g1_i1.p1  ORF type:complete len:239 (+),score=12.37 TRINITY_DN46187_c0_g1_i1:168-884(+)